jgi:hypothetical protein
MQKDRKFSAFVEYCRQLATKHVSIQHTETEKHFFRFELEEVLTGLPSGINFPAFILEGYRFAFTDAKSDNPIKKRSGAFMIVEHVSDIGDFEKIHEVWDKMEDIGGDILARIKADKYNPEAPVYNFNLESVDGSLIGTEIGQLYGVRFTYDIDCQMNIDVDPLKWLPLPEPDPEPVA